MDKLMRLWSFKKVAGRKINLKSMLEEKIINTIEALYNAEQYSIVLILTDGTTLCGNIRSKAQSSECYFSEQCFSRPNTLELYFGGAFGEHSIYVPLEKIAGIVPLSYSQECRGSVYLQEMNKSMSMNFEDSVHETMFRESLREALKRGFKKGKWPFFTPGLYVIKHFVWGEIRFTDNTPLYCDWDYLVRKSGGINSLGVGFGVSVSAGWSRSLWSSFQNKVAKTEISLGEVCSSSEVTLSGHVSFLIHNSDEHSLNKEEILKMEGTNWIGTIITRNRTTLSEELKETTWVICYFREDSLMFAKSLWEKFAEPVRIFGEVVPAFFETEFGKARCFVKARAAAYICKK